MIDTEPCSRAILLKCAVSGLICWEQPPPSSCYKHFFTLMCMRPVNNLSPTAHSCKLLCPKWEGNHSAPQPTNSHVTAATQRTHTHLTSMPCGKWGAMTDECMPTKQQTKKADAS